ncbi:MAG: hypothetical protein GXO43_06990 [Crenarchaeota archaeon]|nr:hypothetical protein [Thermoproteota archaeon]
MLEYSIIKYRLKDIYGNVYTIHKYRGKYMLVSSPDSAVVIARTIRELLEYYYGESRIISIFPDRNGDLHVRYEEPLYDCNDNIIDYEYKEDVWHRIA